MIFALASMHPGTAKPLSSQGVPLLESAGKTLASIQAEDGSYPATGGAWFAFSPVELSQAVQSGAALREAILHGQPWGGIPESAIIYMSDGRDYKLIWHKPGNCTQLHAITPGLVDPVRTAYSRSMIPGGWAVTNPNEQTIAPLKSPMVKPDPAVLNPLFGECWAWGVWTPGAVFW